MPQLRRGDIIEPELSYRIVGILFGVYNELGAGYAERIYQRAIATAFQREGISFIEQMFTPVKYQEHSVGKYILDFLIEKKIVLEIKQGGHFSKQQFNQVLEYLKVQKLLLGILANFTPQGVVFRRVLNPSLVTSHS